MKGQSFKKFQNGNNKIFQTVVPLSSSLINTTLLGGGNVLLDFVSTASFHKLSNVALFFFKELLSWFVMSFPLKDFYEGIIILSVREKKRIIKWHSVKDKSLARKSCF